MINDQMGREQHTLDNLDRAKKPANLPADERSRVDALAAKINEHVTSMDGLEGVINRSKEKLGQQFPDEANQLDHARNEREETSKEKRLAALTKLNQLEELAGPEAKESIVKVRDLIVLDAKKLGATDEEIGTILADDDSGEPQVVVDEVPALSALRRNPLTGELPDRRETRLVEDESEATLAEIKAQLAKAEAEQRELEEKTARLRELIGESEQKYDEILTKNEEDRTEEEKIFLTAFPAIKLFKMIFKDDQKLAEPLYSFLRSYQTENHAGDFQDPTAQEKDFSRLRMNDARLYDFDGKPNLFGIGLSDLRSRNFDKAEDPRLLQANIDPETTLSAMCRYLAVKSGTKEYQRD